MEYPYCKVDLSTPPKLHFLKTYRSAGLEHKSIYKRPHSCEIVYIQEGRLQERTADGEFFYEKGSVHIAVKNEGMHQFSASALYQPFEIGFNFAKPIVPMTQEDVLRWIPTDHEAILVKQVFDPMVAGKLECLIKQAIHSYTSTAPDRFLATRAYLAELFQVMTTLALSQVQSKTESGTKRSAYCAQACSYVAEHLSEPIQEQAVAEALGISTNYLSKLFPQTMGMTLVEYIHRAKLQQVVHLLIDAELTLAEAAEAVGIASTKYLSRLFRRYMGMSATEYKKMHQ